MRAQVWLDEIHPVPALFNAGVLLHNAMEYKKYRKSSLFYMIKQGLLKMKTMYFLCVCPTKVLIRYQAW